MCTGTQSSAEQLEPTKPSPLFYALFDLFYFHGGYQECPPPARLINNCIQCPCRSPSRLPCKHGRLKATLELWWAYPYSAPAHSWQPPSSRAVCSAIKVPELQGVESCLLHLLIRSTGGCPPEIGGCSTAILPSPLLLGATEVSTQQQCAEAQNSEFLPPLHIPTCVQRADLSMLRPTTGTVLVEMLCRPIVVSELADIPLQPPTVVSTCPAHVFHPVASSVLPARIVIPLASPTLDDIRPLSTLQSLCRRPTSRTAIQIPRASDFSQTTLPQLARAERCQAGHSPATPTQIRAAPSPDTRLWARRTSP